MQRPFTVQLLGQSLIHVTLSIIHRKHNKNKLLVITLRLRARRGQGTARTTCSNSCILSSTSLQWPDKWPAQLGSSVLEPLFFYLELSCVSLIAELPVRVAKYMLDA